VDFDDCRSCKVVAVAHCLLNQNARSPGCAECPAAVEQLITGLMQRGIGIIQMPCPELHVICLYRADRDIRRELQSDEGLRICRHLARGVVDQIAEYLACGMSFLGVLGKNNSPSCGVETTHNGGRMPGRGVFIEQLAAELERRGLQIPMAGVLDAEPEAALRVVDGWLAASRSSS